MAQTTGSAAQKSEVDESVEPSMDEILASIRQIIADDETEEQNVTEREQYTHPTDHANDTPSPPSDSDMMASLEAAMAAELSLPVPAAAPTTGRSTIGSEEVRPDTSEENVEQRSARLRAEIGEATAATDADDRLQKYRERGRLRMEALAERKRNESAVAETVPTAAQSASIQEVPKAAVAAPQPDPAKPTLSTRPETPAFVPLTPSPAPPPLARQQSTAAPESRSLAPAPTTKASADDLARLLLQEKGAEIEAMIAGMMRPMVRSWLSDNLTSLVERLVREEIESVSRGRAR